MANQQVMRITLKAYDHQLVDASAKKIIETVKKNGSQVSGPVPLPTKKEVVTILRATHKYKDSREQFEQRTHKRLIDVIAPTQKTVDALQRLEMPAGVSIPADIDAFTNELWENLNADNKISLFVRYTDLETRKFEQRILNKHQ